MTDTITITLATADVARIIDALERDRLVAVRTGAMIADNGPAPYEEALRAAYDEATTATLADIEADDDVDAIRADRAAAQRAREASADW